MNIRYVSQDLAWTESMKKSVQARIVEPLARDLHSRNFEMSVHLDIGWTRTPQLSPRFELWVVVLTFDGGQNSIVRRAGSNFGTVANEVSQGLREELRRPLRRNFSMRDLFINPFRFLSENRSA